MPVNKDNLRLALTALRSGDYAQSRDYLRTNAGYCCLGVKCDVYHKATGLGEWTTHIDPNNDVTRWRFSIDGDWDQFALPNTVAEWYGLENNPVVELGGAHCLAADLNDNVSATAKVAVTEFKPICNETFNDLACAFERVAREIGEDFRGGPRRSRVVYLRN